VLELPSQVKQGQAFEAKAFIQADRSGPASLQLFCNDQLIGEQTIRLDQGKNLFTFPLDPEDPGFYAYELRVEATQDDIAQNNSAHGFADVRGVPKALIVSSDPGADALLARALRSSELNVTVRGVDGLPGSLAELQSYDSLVLYNVLAGDLAREQQRMIQNAVRDFGMGLVCIGGDQAYAAGAYRGTPLAEVLPVDVEISSKKALPPGALVLVIDKSGSMAGEKLMMAKQAAMAAVKADLMGCAKPRSTTSSSSKSL